MGLLSSLPALAALDSLTSMFLLLLNCPVTICFLCYFYFSTFEQGATGTPPGLYGWLNPTMTMPHLCPGVTKKCHCQLFPFHKILDNLRYSLFFNSMVSMYLKHALLLTDLCFTFSVITLIFTITYSW